MDQSTEDFIENVRISLNSKSKYLNEVSISNFKTSVKDFREGLSTVISSLFNAGMLEKDLYKSTQAIYELKLPSMEEIDPSQKDAALSFRLCE